MNYIPNIHFILPAGGVRGAFQAGFLYQLFTNYEDKFNIARIDGTSVGSINGFAIMNKKYKSLKDIWLNIESINDLFDNWSESYVFKDLVSYYHGFYKNGMYSNNKLKNIIIDNSNNTWETLEDDFKSKFSCAVVNINKANTSYINGTNPNIIDYITASAAPWIVTNPVDINGDLYTDGGLLETYPIKYVNKCQADISVIVGFDQEHFSFAPQQNGNLLQYLANLIDIGRFNSINSILTKQLIENDSGVIAIANPMHITFIDFNKEAINDGFRQGIDFANTFYKTYIENFKKNKIA